MKIFITKYALTRGIEEKDCIKINDSCVKYGMDHYKASEWHESKNEAIERANNMKEIKIKSLKRQLQYLEELSF